MKMGLEEIQRRFENALAELNEESEKRGFPQKAIICNEYGVFIDFAGVEINYSLYSLGDNLEDYLTGQAERHESYLRLLQKHKLQTKKELQRCNGGFYTFLQRFSRPSKDELEQKIERAMVKIAFDKAIKEGASLGNLFFEEIVADHTKTRFDDLRQKLVIATENIYDNAKELEDIDIDWLQYFRNKELLWYGKQG